MLSFSPYSFGMGYFYLVPQKNQIYTAILVDSSNRKLAVKMLPKTYDDGYVLQVEKSSGSIHANVFSSGEYGEVSLVVHSRNQIIYSEKHTIKDGKTFFHVDFEKLEEGISLFTVFDPTGKPVCERLFFKQPKPVDIEFICPQKVKTRQKVLLPFSFNEINDAECSISVYHSDDLSDHKQADIQSYNLLTSDLRGNIENPSFYLMNSDSAIIAADNLMLTHGWRRFRWNDVLEDTFFQNHFCLNITDKL
ncbi:MAG: hypothetical protein HC906_10120 [Bacteroidales bacterium]|nr:hypothetical protein [Bacteroidales bacterium]